MKHLHVLFSALLVALPATAMPSKQGQHQAVLHAPNTHDAIRTHKEGVGHFSEWSRATKKEFLIDWQAGREDEWILVQGNEGGDLDSLTSALAWAYHLGHSTQNTSNPIKAIALLQTQTDALDLRPENKVALDNSKMTSGHEDLLTIDELPEDPETLSPKLKGIVLVDHAEPLRKWRKAKILVSTASISLLRLIHVVLL
jgi:exopolyphosphatase